MATSQEYIEFICDQIQGTGNVHYKKMFGEYMVYVNEKPLLLVCDDTVFVKMMPELSTIMNLAEKGFPYNGAKEHYILDIEDRDLSFEVINILEKNIPIPKPRKTKNLGKTNSSRIIEKVVAASDYLTKSNLPASDYVINPYVGCPHGCKYCYACFMKRFTGHSEPWGSFIDIKLCEKPININKITGKSVFLSSVTDCYNSFEEKYGVTRKILEQLVNVDCELGISTKSSLILRDIDLLKKCKNLQVSISINTLDENFKNYMDNASSIKDRLDTLQKLHENGIYTVLFMSPIFPEITDFKAIIEKAKYFVDEFWFENLNLRGSYKQPILDCIYKEYPELYSIYNDIYIKGDKSYWEKLGKEIDEYCITKKIKYINYFYHEKVVAEKIVNQKTAKVKRKSN